jgi:hypothetical protein
VFGLRRKQQQFDQADQRAREVMSTVGTVYAELNEKGELIKSRLCLPFSLFNIRACFMDAYECEFAQLKDDVKHSYHHVYRELAFFVDDKLAMAYKKSMNVAVQHLAKSHFELTGRQPTDDFCRNFLAGRSILVEDPEKFWARLEKQVPNCPAEDRRVLVELLGYCVQLFHALDSEWVAFANLVAYKNRM